MKFARICFLRLCCYDVLRRAKWLKQARRWMLGVLLLGVNGKRVPQMLTHVGLPVTCFLVCLFTFLAYSVVGGGQPFGPRIEGIQDGCFAKFGLHEQAYVVSNPPPS